MQIKRGISILALLLFSGVLVLGVVSADFIGPTAQPPTGDGAISASGGNVGIGTTTPDQKLTIVGALTGYGIHIDSSNGAGIEIDRGATSNAQGIYFQTAGVDDYFIGNYNQPDGLYIKEGGYSGTNLISILSGGNVGIGTTTPSYMLEVIGTGSFSQPVIVGTPTTDSHAATKSYVDSATAGAGSWTTSGNNIYNSNSGNVGIGTGTSTPTAKLDVNGGLSVGTGITAVAAIGTGDILAGNTTGTFQYDASAYITYLQRSSADAGAHHIVGRKSRGTTASSTVITTGDDLLLLRGYGHDGTSFVEGARITLDSQGTIGTGIVPGIIRFYTADAAGTIAQRMAVDDTTLTLSGLTTLTASSLATLTTSAAVNWGGATSVTYTADNATIYGSDVANGNLTLHGTSNATRTTSYLLLQPTAGNVGIGTTTPSVELDVTGKMKIDPTGSIADNYNEGLRISDAANGYAVMHLGGAAAASGTGAGQWTLLSNPSDDFEIRENGAIFMTILDTGPVGIGTTTPTTVLDVASSADAINGITLSRRGGTGDPNNWILWNMDVDAGYGDDFEIWQYPQTGGSFSRFEIRDNGDVYIPGSALYINNGTGKIGIGTVDPVYTIDKKRYATYMSGMVGQKEEITGTIVAGKVNQIDFRALEEGSDLWLFAKVTDLERNFDKMAVLLTPSFPGEVWYEKDLESLRLKIYASGSGGEVTYRLTAPRFDHLTLPTRLGEDGIPGFILNTGKDNRMTSNFNFLDLVSSD